MNQKINEKLISTLFEIGEKVDPVIKELLNSHLDSKFKDIVNYQIEVGGKRLRPALLFACCSLLSGKIKDAIYPAAGIEILHNYTLIIDDIIDNSEIRRNKPTLWKKIGKDISQCVAISYAASIFQAAIPSKNPTLTSEIFSQSLKQVVQGEILDILYERSGRKDEPYVLQNRYKEISIENYLTMITQKTAVLCAASCEIGGISASGTKKQVKLLKEYGFNLGIAFQIQDDILDIFGDQKSFGKEIGKDIKEKKGGNIVILMALQQLKKQEKNEFIKILNKDKITNKDISKSIELINKTNARKDSYEIATYHIDQAKEKLNKLPNNKWNKALKLFSDFVISRDK